MEITADTSAIMAVVLNEPSKPRLLERHLHEHVAGHATGLVDVLGDLHERTGDVLLRQGVRDDQPLRGSCGSDEGQLEPAWPQRGCSVRWTGAWSEDNHDAAVGVQDQAGDLPPGHVTAGRDPDPRPYALSQEYFSPDPTPMAARGTSGPTSHM